MTRQPPFNPDKFQAMLADILDDNLSEADRDSLNAILRDSAEARGLYQRHMELHARLHLDYAVGSTLESMPGLPSMPGTERAFKRKRNISNWWMGIAAAFVGALLLNALLLGLRDGSPTDRIADTSNPIDGVAVLSHAVELEWAKDARPHREGDALPKGRFRIAAGLAQIEFFGGATVILEGPAELELVSAQRARCLHGRLRAFVPEPAQGFTIEAPEFNAVDLGTEFAMSVDTNGRGELHVVDGEVALHKKSGDLIQNLTTGTGVRSTSETEFEAIEAGGSGFVGREQLLKLTGDHWRRQAETWRQSRTRWKDDRDTLVYFDFEDHQAWDRQLRSTKPDGPGGAVVGAQWTQGRWPGKGALEFKRINDRVRINVPGEFESITFAAWVRIEGFDRWLSSLMLTDGWDFGETHWQISDKGELILGINGMGNSFSPPVIGPESLGRWLHLATVYDARTRRVTHYVDGLAIGETQYAKSVPLRIGAAEIGNWTANLNHTSDKNIRSLNGRMDEFLVMRRALTATDIHDMYSSDNPNVELD